MIRKWRGKGMRGEKARKRGDYWPTWWLQKKKKEKKEEEEEEKEEKEKEVIWVSDYLWEKKEVRN